MSLAKPRRAATPDCVGRCWGGPAATITWRSSLPVMRSPSRVVLATATAAFLAACAGVPPPTDRVVRQDPAVVRDRLQAELRSLGLSVTSGDPGVIAAPARHGRADRGRWPAAAGGGGGGQ